MDDGTPALTKAMAAGDGAAVEAFYRRYFDWLYTQARRATRRDEAVCLDIVQESVLRIVRTIRKVQTERQLLAWLKLVVRTTALDLLRSEVRRKDRERIAVALGPAQPSPDETDLDWLRRQVERMDPQIVRLIEMRYQRGWTLAKISRLVGLPIGTVDGRLRRALRNLREIAQEDLDDE